MHAPKAPTPHTASRPSWHAGFATRPGFVLRALAAAVGLSVLAGVLWEISSFPDLRAPAAPAPSVSLVPPVNLTAPASDSATENIPVFIPARSSRSFARPPLHVSWSASTAPKSFAEGVIPAAVVASAVSPSRPARPTSPAATVVTPLEVSPDAGHAPPAPASGPTDAQWAALRACESSYLGYTANTGNGYYGAYQFDFATWRSNGGAGRPDLAAPAEQDRVAKLLFSRRGAQPWPTCGVWLSR